MKLINDIVGKITPIDKKEVDEFRLLVSEAAFLTENRAQITYSKNFPPELAGALGALGAGTIGIATVFAIFSGMSGAEIMSALAGFGLPGAVGGISSVAAVVAAPVILFGGGLFHITNQNKLGRELKGLFEQSYKFEKDLVEDNREVVVNLLNGIEKYREKLEKKHLDLRKIKH